MPANHRSGPPGDPAECLRFGPFVFWPASRRLLCGEREVPLQPKALATLEYLVRRADQTVTKEQLLDALWPGTFVTEGVVARAVRAVRKALDDDAGNPRYVRTVPRVGYRFIAEVAAEGGLSRPLRTVAVLPFRPVATGVRDEELELGMADTLITRLSAIRRLTVRPIAAVRRYNDLGVDPLAAGRDLGVDVVVDGSLQRVGDRLRFTARVLRVADGKALVSDRHDGAVDDLFTIQDTICGRLAAALELELSAAESRRVHDAPTADTDAYRQYLLGRLHLGRRTARSAHDALACFKRAIRKDPGFALAWVGLADAHDALGTLGLDTERHFERARTAAQAALAHDPGLAAAHAALGKVAWQLDWDWTGADAHFARAVDLAPNDPDVRVAVSDFCSYQRRHEESVLHARRAVVLDPTSAWACAILAQALHMAGRDREAVAQAGRALEIAPGFAFAHVFRALALVRLERYAEAVDELERAQEHSDRDDFVGLLGYGYAVAGRTDEARGVLERLQTASTHQSLPAAAFATVLTGLGRLDDAVAAFERSADERSWHVLLLHAEPIFGPVRQHPRAAAVLDRLALAT